MVKHEALMQRAFGRWLQYAYTGPAAVYELKRTLTNSLPLKEIKEHQIRSLSMADTGLYFKIPDDSRGPKPFDCFFLKHIPGYLVVAFGAKLTGFYILRVDHISKLNDDGVVSLTIGYAATHGQYIRIPKK